MRYLSCLVLPLALAATPAVATKADFQNCDGYGAPNSRGDGMTKAASGFLGLFRPEPGRGDTRQRDITLGQAGIAACDAALADPRLLPDYRLRKASLLRARAVHRLMRNDVAAATADLDAAEAAAGAGDLYYKRSMRLGTAMIRAFALYRGGDKAGAAALAAATAAERPYDPELNVAAAQLNLGMTGDWAAFAEALRGIARYDPNRIQQLFALAMAEGRFAEAAALHPQIVLRRPYSSGGYVSADKETWRAEAISEQARLDGELAYALAATGRREQALAALAESRARTAQSVGEPPAPDAAGRGPSKIAKERYALKAKHGDQARQSLDKWERLVALRHRIESGDVDGARADMRASPVPPNGVGADLFEAIARARPALKPEVDLVLAQLRRLLDREKEEAARPDLYTLLELIPETEIEGRIAAYDSGSEGLLSLDTNGFGTKRARIPGMTTIKFASDKSSLAVVSELALLRAAELARRAGKKGVLIGGRRVAERTTYVYYYSTLTNTIPMGHAAELDVAFVDPANLPPEYADSAWRVIDADAVWARLSPVYVRRTAAAAR